MRLRAELCCTLFLLLAGRTPAQSPTDTSWPTYGGDPGGQRYSPADQITPANVRNLHIAWEFHTQALATTNPHRREAAFEATPILHDGTLFLSTPFNHVLAVDAASGQLKWRFDPKVPDNFLAGVYTSRGVAFWQDQGVQQPAIPCDQRIFAATLDGRLLALDAHTGSLCPAFGTNGIVDLKKNLPTQTSEP